MLPLVLSLALAGDPAARPVVDPVLVGVQPGPERLKRADLDDPAPPYGHRGRLGQRRVHGVYPSRRVDGDHRWIPPS